ncbi:MAG: ABC transporter ATP-binding protein [Tropicimonas sp.]|uniref:ABC transporter ATP-binding protein n=1 Tax=Tropicimonas sp. TaxID=2067044 RepID=UPI003A8A13EB
MIEVKDAVLGYGKHTFIKAVDGANLVINPNEIVGIAGESGSGKSTLMRAIYGDFSTGLRMQSGSITASFEGHEPVASSEMRKLWWDTISYVPQGSMSVLNPLLKVHKQLVDGLPARKRGEGHARQKADLARFLEGLGLDPSVLDAFPHQLSGGMRQRVLVAVASYVDPQLILADEPTTALDVVVQKRILMMLVEIQRRLKNTLVLVSHDLGVHYQMTDRLVIMYKGRIVEAGPTDEIFANPQHEYTQRLISSLPRIAQGSRLAASAAPRPAEVTPAPAPADADGLPLLQMEGVSRFFHRGSGLFTRESFAAVDDVTFELPATPCISSIVGESGSGKSTLARMLLRLVEPSKGSVRLLGRPVHGKKAERIPDLDFRRLVQPIFQNPFEAFSAYLPVVHYLRATARNLDVAGDVDAVVDAALRKVGLSLERIEGKFIRQFSGGELQRISVARALIPEPRLIIADEPVSMVDASLRMSIVNIFKEIMEQNRVSFVYITHDLSTAYYLSDRVSIMTRGRIIESGSPAEVLDNPGESYTQELMAAVPEVGRRWPEIAALAGRAADTAPATG